MKNVIYLFWHQKRKKFNFGDDINPFIIESLSGCEVKRVMVLNKKNTVLIDILRLLRGFLKGHYNLSVFSEYIRSRIHTDYLVCIGSILHNNFSGKAKIWGAGIIEKNSRINQSQFYAVRGKETVTRLRQLGYKFDGKIGDPALLLPLIYNPSISERKKIGVVPHVTHFDTVKKYFQNNEDFIIIDLSQNKIKDTVKLFKTCRFIISSSLHGLIISHAYKIPALHVKLGNKLSGDGIKFLDYFSSVGINNYEIIKIPEKQLTDSVYIETLFKKQIYHALPCKTSIAEVQKNLLAVAPFPIVNKYKIYFS